MIYLYLFGTCFHFIYVFMIIVKYGKLKETVFDEFSTSKISLTVRYKFNTTRSKYKGTGAGDSQKNRM